ncbi:MAG: hypothetical protein WBY44_01065 [Bryobacteraceae bacterium]
MDLSGDAASMSTADILDQVGALDDASGMDLSSSIDLSSPTTDLVIAAVLGLAAYLVMR